MAQLEAYRVHIRLQRHDGCQHILVRQHHALRVAYTQQPQQALNSCYGTLRAIVPLRWLA